MSIVIEIIFEPGCRPKRIRVDDMYTKGGMFCVQLPDGYILRWPLCKIHQVGNRHKQHIGTGRDADGVLCEAGDKV